MATVTVNLSTSLDGYTAGPGVDVEHPLGVGGERLHEWLFAEPRDPVDTAWTEELTRDVGAVVLGRRTYDVGLQFWRDVPYPAPSFVLTRERRPRRPMRSGEFTFLDDLPTAIARARDAAGTGTVVLMGVAASRSALAAGLVDVVRLDLVPVLLGGGTRLFEDLPGLRLAQRRVVVSAAVTHLELTCRPT
jgi:dihydrofolate reductase